MFTIETGGKCNMKYGEIVEIGKHRVMCGDATKWEDVERLLKGDKASMCFTDPPWNVGYEGRSQKRKAIINDNISNEEFQRFLNESMKNIATACIEGAGMYVVMSSSSFSVLEKAMVEQGYHRSTMIIWDKGQFVVSWSDYHNQYEPIWYGWTKAKKRLHPVKSRKESNLWKFKKPNKNKIHPTQKPVDLIKKAIINSSEEGEIVIDLFGGSGSTAIAAQETNRICYIMELDPDYCTAIIDRLTMAIGNTM